MSGFQTCRAFGKPWQFWRVLVRHFSWESCHAFLMMRLQLSVLERKPSKAKVPFFHVTSKSHAVNMNYCWSPGSGTVCQGYHLLQKKVTICSPHLRRWENYASFTPWEQRTTISHIMTIAMVVVWKDHVAWRCHSHLYLFPALHDAHTAHKQKH